MFHKTASFMLHTVFLFMLHKACQHSLYMASVFISHNQYQHSFHNVSMFTVKKDVSTLSVHNVDSHGLQCISVHGKKDVARLVFQKILTSRGLQVTMVIVKDTCQRSWNTIFQHSWSTRGVNGHVSQDGIIHVTHGCHCLCSPRRDGHIQTYINQAYKKVGICVNQKSKRLIKYIDISTNFINISTNPMKSENICSQKQKKRWSRTWTFQPSGSIYHPNWQTHQPTRIIC